MNEPLHAALTELARATLVRLNVPGASVALRVDGAPVFHGQFGLGDPGAGTPLAADARFPVYSVTKTLIAATLLGLAEDGRLDLDAPLAAVLPGLDLPPGPTVRQTLNHSAGFPDYGRLPAYQDDLKRDPARPWSVQTFLDRTRPDGLLFPPGHGFAYSNIGYLLLRLLLERLNGQSLKTVLQERLFGPLGLSRTSVAEDLADMATLTPGWSAYWSEDGSPPTLKDVAPFYHPGWVAHGLVVSTAPELLRLTDAMFGGRFFGPAMLRQMSTGVSVGGTHGVFQPPAYGLGVMQAGPGPRPPLVGHAGGGPGYTAGALHWPELHGRKIGSVALVNHDQGDAGLTLASELGQALIPFLDSLPLQDPWRPVGGSPA